MRSGANAAYQSAVAVMLLMKIKCSQTTTAQSFE